MLATSNHSSQPLTGSIKAGPPRLVTVPSSAHSAIHQRLGPGDRSFPERRGGLFQRLEGAEEEVTSSIDLRVRRVNGIEAGGPSGVRTGEVESADGGGVDGSGGGGSREGAFVGHVAADPGELGDLPRLPEVGHGVRKSNSINGRQERAKRKSARNEDNENQEPGTTGRKLLTLWNPSSRPKREWR